MTGVGVQGNDTNIRPGLDHAGFRRGRMLDAPQCYGSHSEARAHLNEVVGRVIGTNEFPGGTVEARGDFVVLTNVPHSGAEMPLFEIKPECGGYKIDYHVDLPDYLRN